MKYRFAYDRFGRFIYETIDDGSAYFDILGWNRYNKIFQYRGSIDVLDVSCNSELIAREDELLCNL